MRSRQIGQVDLDFLAAEREAGLATLDPSVALAVTVDGMMAGYAQQAMAWENCTTLFSKPQDVHWRESCSTGIHPSIGVEWFRYQFNTTTTRNEDRWSKSHRQKLAGISQPQC